MSKYWDMLRESGAELFEVHDVTDGEYDFYAYRVVFASGVKVPVFVNPAAISAVARIDIVTYADALVFVCECLEAISDDEIVAIEPVEDDGDEDE